MRRFRIPHRSIPFGLLQRAATEWSTDNATRASISGGQREYGTRWRDPNLFSALNLAPRMPPLLNPQIRWPPEIDALVFFTLYP
jgi:hypothetical protein